MQFKTVLCKGWLYFRKEMSRKQERGEKDKCKNEEDHGFREKGLN